MRKGLLVLAYFVGVLVPTAIGLALYLGPAGKPSHLLVLSVCIAGMKVGCFGEALLLDGGGAPPSARSALMRGGFASVLDTLVSAVGVMLVSLVLRLLNAGVIAIVILGFVGAIVVPATLSAAVLTTMASVPRRAR